MTEFNIELCGYRVMYSVMCEIQQKLYDKQHFEQTLEKGKL